MFGANLQIFYPIQIKSEYFTTHKIFFEFVRPVKLTNLKDISVNLSYWLQHQLLISQTLHSASVALYV